MYVFFELFENGLTKREGIGCVACILVFSDLACVGRGAGLIGVRGGRAKYEDLQIEKRKYKSYHASL